jgi:hypothetical protein
MICNPALGDESDGTCLSTVMGSQSNTFCLDVEVEHRDQHGRALTTRMRSSLTTLLQAMLKVVYLKSRNE